MALQRWSKQTTGVYTVLVDTQQVVYTFPAIPQGFAASVSVAVPGSGAAVNWTVLVSGQVVGSTLGAQPCGPIYLGQGDVLSLIGLPITNVGVAVASGAIGLPTEIPPASIITNNAQGVVGANLVAVGTSAGPTPAIPLNSSIRGILILTNPSVYPTNPPNDAGLFLPVNQGAIQSQFGASGLADGVWFLSTAGLPSIQVAFSASTSWEIFTVANDFDFYEVARGLGAYTITVPVPAPGADWSYVLPAPGRLVAIVTQLVTSAVVANRTPRLYLDAGAKGQLSLSPANIPASQNYTMNVFPGASATTAGGAGVFFTTTPIPDLLMGAGMEVLTNTVNLDAGDAWQYIALTFTPI